MNNLTNISISNTTLIIAGNRSADPSYEIVKDLNRKATKALKANGEDLEKKRKKWDYVLNHDSDNQIMKSYF